MAGRGRAPKAPEERHNPRSKPVHEWQPAECVGWQHGDVPAPPAKLTKAAREAWATWFGAWWASHWRPEDIPGLRQVIRLYDQVERGEFQRASELRLAMDTYGITPKGQQDRRWKPPAAEPADQQGGGQAASGGRYGHLRSVAGQ